MIGTAVRRWVLRGGLSVVCLTGCAGSGKPKPGWVDGSLADYPPAQYLVGIGMAESRRGADDQAYAALARIFKVEVAAQAKDWESYLLVEQRGASNAERRLTLDTVTKVSTDKVLENVRILDAWYDAQKGLHYALAVMHRPQAEASLTERIALVDREIEADVREARQPGDALARVRRLRHAVNSAVLREAYNADLRVVRQSGQGVPAAYSARTLSNELDQLLAAHLLVSVEVHGDHAEPIQRAITEGLIREGLHVSSAAQGQGEGPPSILVRGETRMWPLNTGDPQFKYVRWCSDFEIVESPAQRVLGAVSRGGKEGHLTEREATAKALRVVQQEFSSDMAKAIAAHIYGEAELPVSVAAPAGCPRETSVGMPQQ